MSRAGTGKIRVLHVDDDPALADLVARHLERLLDDVSVATATSARDALGHLESDPVDCVVSDLEMPGMDGLEFLRAVRERHEDLPFILFTGKGSEEIASEAIAAGVTEYLQKGTSPDQYEVLAHRVDRAVTERRARAAAAESERMFATLVENLPGMVYRSEVAEGWPMEYVSEGCRALTGYDPSALESEEVSWGESVIHPDDREAVWEPVEAGINDGDSFQVSYRIVTADGETRWVWERGSPVYDADGDLSHLEGFITDVTDERERQEALREERAVTELALDAIDDAFYVIDHETGAFRRWNDRLPESTGYASEELEDMTVFDLVAPEQEVAVETAAERTLAGTPEPLEIDVQRKDGERIPVEIRSAPIRDNGDLLGIGGIARDVSERARREERLEEFAHVVSHDLQNPLRVVQGRVELAQQTGDLDHLEPVAAAADRMDAMIDDLLALALEGDTVGTIESVDLGVLARETWQTVETADATLEVENPETVEADPARLRDVLANLFHNAVEHGAGDARSLTLEEAVDRAGDQASGADEIDGAVDRTVTVLVGGDEDGFFVADDGPGVPPAERESVFEHGYTTAADGTGFGLSIVESVAQAHGWSVALTESRWGGARVEFRT